MRDREYRCRCCGAWVPWSDGTTDLIECCAACWTLADCIWRLLELPPVTERSYLTLCGRWMEWRPLGVPPLPLGPGGER